MGTHRSARRWLVAVVAGVLGASGLVAVAAAAGSPASVTRGELVPFAAGADGSTSGRARMIRTSHGTTIVQLHVRGLVSGGQYASHVHAAPCRVGAADGHYKHDPAGPSTPPNEIWPGGGPFTASRAGTASERAVAGFVAGANAVSVVVHDLSLPSTANKIACADLGGAIH